MTASGSVGLIREAKSRGLPISGEACPHHFTLTDSAIAGSDKFWLEDGKGTSLAWVTGATGWPEYDTNFKMNPPLRSASDREAVMRASPTARWKSSRATTRRTATTKRRSSSPTRRSVSPAWRTSWRCR
ncbi:MAG: hypothetical protein CM1200mP29_17180 [Verrucomicrobiota bacterium]|nr:MAG: hypothetical protein CM1200mP29_17180 [Verrucomicrobiota bacterium]